jgi:hypothetical protein
MEYHEEEYVPEITPRIEDINEIVPEKDVPKNPWDGAIIIGNMTEEERKEKERQKKINDIIEKRDTPKTIH